MLVYWKAKPELLEFDSSSGTQIFLLYLTDKEMNGNSFYFFNEITDGNLNKLSTEFRFFHSITLITLRSD